MWPQYRPPACFCLGCDLTMGLTLIFFVWLEKLFKKDYSFMACENDQMVLFHEFYKVLREHRHAHLFRYYLLSYYSSKVV